MRWKIVTCKMVANGILITHFYKASTEIFYRLNETLHETTRNTEDLDVTSTVASEVYHDEIG